MNNSEVMRLRNDNWFDYFGIVKSFCWDNPIEVDPNLYLGNLSHSFFFNTLNGCRIRGIVNVTNESPNYYLGQDIDYFNIHIGDLNNADITEFLEQSYEFINRHISKGENVLVHCVFGRSRSVAICVYYLMKKYNLSFDEAYRKIECKKYFVNINRSFVDQINTHFLKKRGSTPQ